MKYNIPPPNLVSQYNTGSPTERREMIFLAFEAEFDIDRPFELDWGPDDKYFMYDSHLYLYKPQYAARLEEIDNIGEFIDSRLAGIPVLTTETPHFFQFTVE